MGKRYGWRATRGSAPKWIRFGVALVIFLSIVTPEVALAGVSGTYVGASSGEVNMIQIVETSGHHLIGHMEEDRLTGGTVQATNLTITGAVSGETVIMNIGSSILGTISASGTISAGTLHLVGGSGESSFDMTLTKGSLSEFQMAVSLLNHEAMADEKAITASKERSNARKAFLTNLVVAEKRMKSDLANTERVNSSMKGYPKLLFLRTKQLHAIDRRYQSTTQKMAEYLARERSIFGNGQEMVARSQISNAEIQMSLSENDLHMSVDEHIENLKRSKPLMLAQIKNSEIACKSASAVQIAPAMKDLSSKSDELQAGIDAGKISGKRQVQAQQAISLSKDIVNTASHLTIACDQFNILLPKFRDEVKLDGGLYTTEEQIWDEQRAKQKQILSEAQAAIQ